MASGFFVNLHKVILSLALLLSLGAFAGCDTDTLMSGCPDDITRGGAHVSVMFDWGDAPDADPKGMRVAFHPLDSRAGEPLRFDLGGRDGGVVNLGPGRYAVLAYNNDTQTIRFDDLDDWDNASIRTGSSTITEPMTRDGSGNESSYRPVGDEDVKAVPDRIWGAAADTVTVRNDGTAQNIQLRPQRMYCDYDYEIKNVANLDRATYMSASITGMCDGVSLSRNSKSGRRCTFAIPAAKRDATTIAGTFRTFGHNTADTTAHFMELYVITNDGRKLRFKGGRHTMWDVTDQVENAPDPHNVHIVINGLEIPAANDSVPQGGFEPGIDGWQDEHVVIPV